MAETYSMEELKKRLQATQRKMTPQRQIVLQVILDHPGEHLSAEKIYDILRGTESEIGLATVYRSLEILVSLGILQKIEFGKEFDKRNKGSYSYELNPVDPNQHFHHHLICTECKEIAEFEEDMLDHLEEDIFKKTGFKVENHQAKFFGICRKCWEKKKNA